MSSTNVQKSSDNKAGSADHSNDRSADRTSVGLTMQYKPAASLVFRSLMRV
jgi:hypothetical protein